jgi:hypothetical protein
MLLLPKPPTTFRTTGIDNIIYEYYTSVQTYEITLKRIGIRIGKMKRIIRALEALGRCGS